MLTYTCDGCGRSIPPKSLRYSVTIDVRAAYDQIKIGLADLVRDHRREILDLIEQLKTKPAEELEAQVYKQITLDLCPPCQRAFIKAPLRYHPEQAVDDGPVDIDAFLRSLGYGSSGERE